MQFVCERRQVWWYNNLPPCISTVWVAFNFNCTKFDFEPPHVYSEEAYDITIPPSGSVHVKKGKNLQNFYFHADAGLPKIWCLA